MTLGRLYQRPSDELVVPTPGSDFTGFITVSTPGTEVQGPDISGPNGFYICGAPTNTGNVYVQANGQQSSDCGFPLDALQQILVRVSSLYSLSFDADVGGEKICWIKA